MFSPFWQPPSTATSTLTPPQARHAHARWGGHRSPPAGHRDTAIERTGVPATQPPDRRWRARQPAQSDSAAPHSRRAVSCSGRVVRCSRRAGPCSGRGVSCSGRAVSCSGRVVRCSRRAGPCSRRAVPCSGCTVPCSRQAGPCSGCGVPCSGHAGFVVRSSAMSGQIVSAAPRVVLHRHVLRRVCPAGGCLCPFMRPNPSPRGRRVRVPLRAGGTACSGQGRWLMRTTECDKS